MKLPTIPFLLLFLMLSLGCKKNNQKGNSDGQENLPNLPPVETRSPNTDYAPAFAGQTRGAGMETQTTLKINVLTSSLQKPWGITALPDSNWLITQKEGNVVVLNSDGSLKATISGLPAVNSNGQGGLLDVALDPQFQQNRMVYWTFSDNVNGGTVTAVAKGRLSENETAITGIQVIYQALPAHQGVNHYGGRLAFDQNGYIFVSTGERYDLTTRPLAQDKSTALGKILRITTDGQPAPGNPFLNDTSALPELYSYGHRNVEGLAFDPQHNTLWEAEMGPMGGDEVNHIEAGKNYGWPVITYGLEYSGEKVGDGITQKEGMEQPVYYWDPSISPSGMVFYDNDYLAEWKNTLLIGCLSGKHIVRLWLRDGLMIGEERLLESEGQRFRDLAVGLDGKVYAITDQGRLYQIEKSKE